MYLLSILLNSRRLLAMTSLIILMTSSVTSQQKDVSCDKSSIEVVILIDVTSSNSTLFSVQKNRVNDVLHHLANVTSGRRLRYGLILFHKSPKTVLELASPFSEDTNKITSLINILRPRILKESSVARAYDLATQQLSQYGDKDSHKLVLLAHDGLNSDSVAETLEASNSIEDLNVDIFAISGSTEANSYALQGYTGDRKRVFIQSKDAEVFYSSIDETVGVCVDKQEKPLFETVKHRNKMFGVRAARAETQKKVFDSSASCGHDKVDLMIVLDTSGSVFNVFNDQRQIALDLLETFPSSAYHDRLQVSVVRFAASADVIVPFLRGRNKEEVAEEIRNIKFTGQNTRIASAVKLAVEELVRARRKDARQIFLLISDGHGQEYWNVVQSTGRKLQETEAEIFAASASSDYNEAELFIYVGDESRLFVGRKYTGFILTLSSYVRSCLTGVKEGFPVGDFDKQIDNEIKPSTIVTSTSGPTTSTTKENDVALDKVIESLEGSGEDESGDEADVEDEGEGEDGSGGEEGTQVDATEKEEEIQKKLRDDKQNEGDSRCQVDLIMIIDRSQSVDSQFNRQIQTSLAVVRQPSPSDYSSSRIRVGVVSFARNAIVERELTTGSRDDVINTISNIHHTGGSTSTVEGAKLVIANLVSSRRQQARLVILLISDGHSQDYWKQIIRTSSLLRKEPDTVLMAFTASDQFSHQELEIWTGNASNVFESTEEEKFLSSVHNVVLPSHCTPQKGTFETKLLETSLEISKKIPEENEEEQKPQVNNTKDVIDEPEVIETTTEPRVHGIKTSPDQEKPNKMVFIGDRNCLIDLTFVIDVSTSVEADFQKQIQLPIDLIKRIPDPEFENRVRVAVVLFNLKANVTISLDKETIKNSLLDVLLSLDNTGGGTSLVAGIEEAMNEMKNHKRPNARQVLVLISDGNSQDPWKDVLRVSNRLRVSPIEVYAATVHKNYKFRELELYAGDKRRVFIDARTKKQFLSELESTLDSCSPLIPTTTFSPAVDSSQCSRDIELVLVVDNGHDDNVFHRQKQYLIDLLDLISPRLFQKRLSVSIVSSSDSPLTSLTTKDDVIYELERIPFDHSNNTSDDLDDVIDVIQSLDSSRSNGSQLIIVFSTDGQWKKTSEIDELTKLLNDVEAESFAISTSDDVSLENLRRMTSAESHIYITSRLDMFSTEVADVLVNCRPSSRRQHAAATSDNSLSLTPLKELPREDQLVRFDDDMAQDGHFRCKYHKIDLQIILDASSSREDVFEHQRELALSLIERLPISAEGTHVAVGINSFTSVPVLRQTLGLGRNKKMVRRVIEDISYNGGSTLTAEAVRLSVKDLQRGKRPDALQIVVLMNDGISQDRWEDVVEAGKELHETNAEIFGVALGEQIDLRELHQYVPQPERIYRDGSTEEFLSDVVNLLKVDKSCHEETDTKQQQQQQQQQHQRDEKQHKPVSSCEKPILNVVFLLDKTRKSDDFTIINSNKYLMLDILGSLVNNSHVRVAVVSFDERPKVEFDFMAISKRDRLFARVESIRAVKGEASYVNAINFGLDKLKQEADSIKNSMSSLVVIGDGQHKLIPSEALKVSERLKEFPSLLYGSLDSSTNTSIDKLSLLMGDKNKVFSYNTNAIFAQKLMDLAENTEQIDNCEDTVHRMHGTKLIDGEHTTVNINGPKDWVYSTIGPLTGKNFVDSREVQRDLAGEPLNILKDNELVKIVAKPFFPLPPITSETSTTPLAPTTTTTRRPTTTTISTSPRPLTTPSFVSVFRARPTEASLEPQTTFRPGCLVDVIMILDASGSVEETFKREKELAAGIIDQFRVGPDNARVGLIKFAAEHKVKTIWSLKDTQSRGRMLKNLQNVPFSSGTTAIHSAILQAVSEYTIDNGARPGIAKPLVIIFTDGYGKKPVEAEAQLLRRLIPNTYAVAINHQFPISRVELEKITGDASRVYTDANIRELHDELKPFTTDCVFD